MTTDPTRPGPERYGRYCLIERIGKGGMAEVFRAYVDGLEGYRDTFVIKRIRPEKSDSAEFVEMFVNEARICALLHHPNIVEVYDFGQIGGAYFMAMEYLRGRDLASVMRALRLRFAAVPPLVAAHVAQQVALGLHHAHEARLPDGRPAEIVHRDVTPSNIMLLTDGGVKVLDFGIAKAAAAAQAPADEKAPKRPVKGKMAYLSPEQVRNGDLDARSDVFSLGVVLWEMLVGQRLFSGENEFQTVRNVLTMAVPPPSSKRAEVPRALDAVVLRALERDPARRFSSTRDLAEALAAVVGPAADAQAGLRDLLAELFGDGAPGGVPERMTSTFSAGTFSSSPSPPARSPSGEAPPPEPPEPESPTTLAPPALVSAPRHRVLPWTAGLLLVACLGWAAWRSTARRTAAPAPPAARRAH